MGFYVETGSAKGKANVIEQRYGAIKVTHDEARKAVVVGLGVIVVLHNGPFEAAGFAFDVAEFDAFTSDNRVKEYLMGDREKLAAAAGYKE